MIGGAGASAGGSAAEDPVALAAQVKHFPL